MVELVLVMAAMAAVLSLIYKCSNTKGIIIII